MKAAVKKPSKSTLKIAQEVLREADVLAAELKSLQRIISQSILLIEDCKVMATRHLAKRD